MSSTSGGSAPNLGPGTLQASVGSTGKAIVIVQTYAKNITTQPIIQGLDTEIPNLSTHQQTAVNHANNWLTTYQPQILQVQSDLLSFANGFNAYYNPLLTLAQQIQNGDTSKVNEFIQGLQQLTTQVTNKRTAVKTVVTDLNTFSTELGSDVSNFNTDAQTADTKIVGNNGTLQRLRDELVSLNSAMNKDNAMIAGGVVMTFVGALMICIGALGEFETGGLSTGLILAGIGLGAGGGTMIGLAAKNLASSQDTYGNTMTRISSINANLNVLMTVKAQLNNFSSEATNAYNAVVTMDTGYQTLETNFNDLISDLQNNIHTTSPFLVASLQQAYADWGDVKKQIENIQQYGDIPTTNQTVSQYLKKAA
jgi:ABC-type transporter Mla subunit MlaD